MIPTYITVALILPGYGTTEDSLDRASDNYSTMLGYLENEAHSIYAINRKARFAAYEGGLPEIKDGLLAEPLLVFEDMREVGTFVEPATHPWLSEYISEGCCADYDEKNMEAIYQDVLEILKETRDRARNTDTVPADCKFWRFSFLAGWDIRSSVDRETGHADIDAINYAGRLKCVPISTE